MKKFPITLAGLALASCSTMTITRLESRPPRDTFTLNQSPEGFARCIVETMGRLGSPTQYTRSEGTRVISFTLENQTSALYLIKGQTVEVRTIGRIVPFRSGTRACLG